MSEPAMTPVAIGTRLKGVRYDFKAGDILPMHNHGPTDVHITVVLAGDFSMAGDDWAYSCGPGTWVDWPEGVNHEIRAITSGSIINLIKN